VIEHGTLDGGGAVETFPLLAGFAKRTTILKNDEAARPSPHAFLIEQSPGSEVRAHFHHNAEFQVMVAGSGRLGRHPVGPLIVHYAGQQTGYGPIIAGDSGLSYITLRAVTEFGAWFLPEMGPSVDRRIPKGQTTSPQVDAVDLAGIVAPQLMTMVDPKPSGLAAWLMRLPPGGSARAPEHAGGAGRFYLVTGGRMRHGGELLGRWSCAWSAADEVLFDVVAGSEGLECLVLQFPAKAWAFESMLGQARDGEPARLPPLGAR
jgi:hypothetical protein